MDGMILRFPVSSWKRLQNQRGKRAVSCIVSDSWLQFGEPHHENLNIGTPISLDVMTDAVDDRKPRKLCNLIVTVEQLKALVELVNAECGKR